jgi:hypothetical protein
MSENSIHTPEGARIAEHDGTMVGFAEALRKLPPGQYVAMDGRWQVDTDQPVDGPDGVMGIRVRTSRAVAVR